MPDDEILEQEVAEQPDKEMEEGFDLGVKDESILPESEETNLAMEESTVEESTGEEAVEEEPEKEEAQKPVIEEKEITAKDRIDQRIKEAEVPVVEETPVKEVETPLPVKPVAPPVKPVISKILTKEQVSDHLNSFSDDNLPENSIFIGDVEVDLREFAKEDPEQFAAVKVLSSAIAQQAIDKALESRVPSTKIQDQLDEQQRTINSLLWWDTVTEKHADGKRIKDDPKFHKWFDTQPENIQRFGYADASPEDAILILDFYKEDIAKKDIKKHDDSARDKKKQTDDLHKNTMRVKNNTGVQENGMDMEDAEAGFNEGLKAEL